MSENLRSYKCMEYLLSWGLIPETCKQCWELIVQLMFWVETLYPLIKFTYLVILADQSFALNFTLCECFFVYLFVLFVCLFFTSVRAINRKRIRTDDNCISDLHAVLGFT